MTSILTSELTSRNLPHASYLSARQNPVSVIIRCKRSYSWSVENTALSHDEEHVTGAACCVTCGGIMTTPSRDIRGVYI